MHSGHLAEGLASVDVPDGHRAATVAGDDEAVAPVELDYCVFVPIEEALSALDCIQVPD